jgi:hypothetical protein
MAYATIHKNLLNAYFLGNANPYVFLNLSKDILHDYLILFECDFEIYPLTCNHFIKSYFEKDLYTSRKQMRKICK